MAKRKKEIKKRKKQIEEAAPEEDLQASDPAEVPEEPIEARSDGEAEEETPLTEKPVDDSQIVAAPAPPVEKRASKKGSRPAAKQTVHQGSGSWFNQNKENFLLGLLILYVLLLGLGTVGELFEIEWILNLPLFR